MVHIFYYRWCFSSSPTFNPDYGPLIRFRFPFATFPVYTVRNFVYHYFIKLARLSFFARCGTSGAVTVAGLAFVQISMTSAFIASGNKDFLLHTLPKWTYDRYCLLISMHSTYHSNRFLPSSKYPKLLS